MTIECLSSKKEGLDILEKIIAFLEEKEGLKMLAHTLKEIAKDETKKDLLMHEFNLRRVTLDSFSILYVHQIIEVNDLLKKLLETENEKKQETIAKEITSKIA